jgi:hypothetical protein
VLGLNWANIRVKLVKVMGETAVKAMETGCDIVVRLVRDGPAAAWDKIKEQLSNLKDMMICGITDFVVDMVVKKAMLGMQVLFSQWRGLAGKPTFQLHGVVDDPRFLQGEVGPDAININQAVIDLLAVRDGGEWRIPSQAEIEAEIAYGEEVARSFCDPGP